MGVSGNHGLEEDRRRKKGPKPLGRSSSIGCNRGMHNLCCKRVACDGSSNRFGQSTAASLRRDQERLNRCCCRAGLVKAHVGTEKSRQNQLIQLFCRQRCQVDHDFGTRMRDQGGGGNLSTPWVLTEFQSRCLLDDLSQFGMLCEDQRLPVAPFQSQSIPDDQGIRLGRQRNHFELGFTRRSLDSLLSDNTTNILPRGKAITHGERGIHAVVAAE